MPKAICHLLMMVALLLSTSCATSPRPLSGKNDIPMLLPGEMYASWIIDQAEFDQSRYYVISKYQPDGKSIAIYASDEGEAVAPATAKKVAIPEIGEVRYRTVSAQQSTSCRDAIDLLTLAVMLFSRLLCAAA
jgi:hypothetical protein